MSAPSIEVKVEYDAVRVLINDVLHLHFPRSKLLGVQSWVREPEGKFVIEYTMAGGTIESDYDSREKWLSVLAWLGKGFVARGAGSWRNRLMQNCYI